MIGKMKKLNADEAISRKGTFGGNIEEDIKKIENLQDDRFTDIWSLRFGWVEQQSDKGSKTQKKLMSMLPNGKVVFIDRYQNDTDIVPEDPYICLVYEREREAFAKIIFPEYQPKIYIPPSRLPVMVWRDNKGRIQRRLGKGNSYEMRLLDCIKEMEKLGFDSVKIVYRKYSR